MKPREFNLHFDQNSDNPRVEVASESVFIKPFERILLREVLPATECADLEVLLAERNRQAQLAAANYDRINGLRNAAIAERDEALAHIEMLPLRKCHDVEYYDADNDPQCYETCGACKAIALLAKAKGRAE